MKNKILYIISQGLGRIDITRQDNTTRRYEVGKLSFNRYMRTMKALNWSEERCGLGISLREPPKVVPHAG